MGVLRVQTQMDKINFILIILVLFSQVLTFKLYKKVLRPACYRLLEKNLNNDLELASIENQIVLTLSAKSFEIFDISSKKVYTKQSIDLWETNLNSLTSEIRQLRDKKMILAIYSTVLSIAAPKELDLLQFATFELISHAVVDSLLKLQVKGAAVTGLIDDITDVHLSYIEQFRVHVEDGIDDGFFISIYLSAIFYCFF
jgi:hypothetical protein